jgi:hypothetical protein
MPKKYKYTKKTGRPTKYNPIYCQQILDYFEIEIQNFRDVVFTYKNGDTKETTEEEASPLPTFRKFARSIDVDHTTLLEWCKKYPEFSTAYNRSKEAQQEFIMENALRENYSAYFAGLMMKNMFGWKEKTETEHKGEITIMPQITKGGKPLEFKVGD